MAAAVTTMPPPADIPSPAVESRGRQGTKKSPIESDPPKVGKRGRPRVDPQDQSAAERRRTQIRLAQRAYRERKETTIAELEAKVQQIQNSLQQVRDVIVDFRTLAMDAGMETWNASISMALEDTVDKVFQVAGEVSSTPTPEEEPRRNSPKRKRAHSPEPDKQICKVDGTVHREDWLSSAPVPQTQRPAPWGYQWTFDDNTVAEMDQIPPDVAETCSTWLEGTQLTTSLPDRPVEPPVAIFTEGWKPTIGKELQPYHSYHLPETSWARRFHRFCYENTYALLTNPASPPNELHRKLRYSLCFGSIRMIAERIKWKLMRSPDEPMEMWDLPVLHIGGAGFNFPREGIDSTVPPRQGFAAEHNIGPFQRRGHTTPPASVYPYQVAQWLGIDGAWFDGYDVEQYLRTKGLHLDGWSTLVTMEVDDAGRPISSNLELSSPNGASTLSYSGPQSPMAPEEVATDFFPAMIDPTLEYVPTDGDFGFDSSMDIDDPINAAIAPPKFGTDMTSITEPTTLVNGVLNNGQALSKRRQVIIDVQRLMQEFYNKTICIGRSPGIKRDQVDDALQSVIQESLDPY